jgi:curved DNA-binding protein CbpA
MSRKINAARKREKYRQLAVFYHPDKNLNSGIDYARDLF